jgi:hypothetical protein
MYDVRMKRRKSLVIVQKPIASWSNDLRYEIDNEILFFSATHGEMNILEIERVLEALKC